MNYDKSGYICSIYSKNDIGNKEVPTNEVVLKIAIRKNRGYVCKKSAFQGLVVKNAIRCGEPIESKYYNKNGTRDGRIITEYIIFLCYYLDGILKS